MTCVNQPHIARCGAGRALSRPVAEPSMMGGMADEAKEIRTLLILGASGDLASRLLLPGLGRLLASGRAGHLQLVGSGVDELSDDQWRDRLREAFAVAPSIEVAPWERVPPAPKEPGDAALRRLERESVYLKADVTKADDLRRLLDRCSGPVAIYFALPPAVTEQRSEERSVGEEWSGRWARGAGEQ